MEGISKKEFGDFTEGFKTYAENVKEVMSGMATTDEINQIKSVISNIETQIKRVDLGSIQEKGHIAGQNWARIAKCSVVAKQEGKSISDIAEEIYGTVDAQFVQEVKTLQAGGNAGSVLIEEAYYNEVLPLLYNNLVVMALGARKVPMPNGVLNIRKMVAGSTFSYVGESKPPLKSTARFANLRLSGKKGRALTVFSNDLLRSSSPDADRLVRDDLVMQARIGMDYYALYGTGKENTPTGIFNTSNVTKVTGTPNIDGDDLYKRMVEPLKTNNIMMNSPGWAFPPEVYTDLYNETFENGTYKYRGELKEGKFHGYPFKESNQLKVSSNGATADIVFADWENFFIGEQVEMEIRVSDESTYIDENNERQSAFENDETIVQLLMIHDYGVIYPKAFSVGTFTRVTS